MNENRNTVKLKRLGIDTYRENIIFMRSDSHICTAEGFTALTRVLVTYKNKSIVATLNVVHSNLLSEGEVALSEIAFDRLEANETDEVYISHLKSISSLGDVRAKMYRKKLSEEAFKRIISDVTEGLYSDIELAAFVSACSGDNLDLDEITWLTEAMVESGTKINWNEKLIIDKHCIGGLPGNRTTPIVVSIIASAGLIIPKTSSRAITSPAGTSDTLDVITNVNLPLETMKEVVKKENGCFSWGGSVDLSPADDILISVERALDIDSEGQMIASVLSKKAAAGSTHVVIDIPVGKTAKVRSEESALKLEYIFKAVGKAIGVHVETIITDGSQPIGRGIGPALEAMDILAVLRNEKNAPQDLKQRSIQIAAVMLELASKAEKGDGEKLATEILETGKAWEKFYNICLAQGRFSEPEFAKYKLEIFSETEGVVKEIDNRRLARIAKLAGAPKSSSAGVLFFSPLGTKIKKRQILFTVYAESEGELHYANEYLKSDNHILKIE
jgi:thymidine phosphorylase